MGAIVDRAEALATLFRVAGDPEAVPPVASIRSSTSIRDTVPPCLLVVPVPGLDYSESSLSGSVEVEWTVVALAAPPADLEAARELELLVSHVAGLVDVTSARPASYRIPSTETDVPAYLISFTETAETEE